MLTGCFSQAKVSAARILNIYSMRARWIWVGYNYLISNKRKWNNCFINFFELQTSGYYNWILVNFILNITKRPDINVTSGKSHDNCAPFANLVECRNWKRRTLCLNYSRKVLFSLSLAVTGIWRWSGRPDCSSISFSSSTESELHKDPASLINLLLLSLFNGKPLVAQAAQT